MITDISFYTTLIADFATILCAFFVYSNSLKLEKNILHGSKDGKLITRLSRLFQVTFYSAAGLTLLSLIAKILYSISLFNGISGISQILQGNLSSFVLHLVSLTLSLVMIFVAWFGFLYYRYKIEYRHYFIRRVVLLLSLIVLVDIALMIPDYYSKLSLFVIPQIGQVIPQAFGENVTLMPGGVTIAYILFTIVFIVVHMFVLKKSATGFLNIYVLIAIAYFVLSQLFIVHGMANYYASLTSTDALLLFNKRYWFVGYLWIYLSAIFIMSLICSQIISRTSIHFIGKQFSISYAMILMRFNFSSGVILWLLAISPILLKYYFSIAATL